MDLPTLNGSPKQGILDLCGFWPGHSPLLSYFMTKFYAQPMLSGLSTRYHRAVQSCHSILDTLHSIDRCAFDAHNLNVAFALEVQRDFIQQNGRCERNSLNTGTCVSRDPGATGETVGGAPPVVAIGWRIKQLTDWPTRGCGILALAGPEHVIACNIQRKIGRKQGE